MHKIFGRAVCVPLFCLLITAGCEDLELPFPAESDSETTEATPAEEPAATSPAADTDPTPATPAAPTPAPAPMTAASILAAIQDKPSMEVTDQDLQQFSQIDEGLEIVTELNLKGAKLTEAGLKALADLPALKKLDLESGRIREGEWKGLSGATSLEWLGLKDASLNDRSVAAIGELSNLRQLDLSSTLVTDQGFKHLTGLSSLEVLMVNGNNFSGDGMEALGRKGAGAPLRVIHAASTTFGIRGFVHIKDFGDLEELIVPDATVTDNSLNGLKRMTSLVRVSLRNNDRVTDAGLKAFAKSKGLVFLDLNGIRKISDFTFKTFQRHKELKELRINDSVACTPEGIEKFKKALPDCKVTLRNQEF